MAEKQVHLTCGSSFLVEDGEVTPVFIEVEDVTTLGGELGEIGTFIESTTIKDCAKKYIAGLSDAPDLTVSFLWSGSTNQINFKDASIARETRPAKVVFSDPTGASPVITVSFDLVMAGFTMGDPAPDTLLTASVNGKASNFIWS